MLLTLDLSLKWPVLSVLSMGWDVCRYEFSSVAEGDQLHALLSAVVLAGRLYLVGATSPEGQWAAASSDISSAVTSFRLVKQLR